MRPGELLVQFDRVVGDVLDGQNVAVQNRGAYLMAPLEIGQRRLNGDHVSVTHKKKIGSSSGFFRDGSLGATGMASRPASHCVEILKMECHFAIASRAKRGILWVIVRDYRRLP